MSPSGDVNVTGTFTTTGSPFLLEISFGNSGISPTVTVYPSGTCAGKSGVLINSSALAFTVSLTLSGVVPFGTSTAPLVRGRTVTGTVTFSVTSVPSTLWVTVVGIVNPDSPALPSVLKISLAFGSFAVPVPTVVAGSTFSLTSAGVISSPSNTTTGLVLDLTTFTSMSTVVS